MIAISVAVGLSENPCLWVYFLPFLRKARAFSKASIYVWIRFSLAAGVSGFIIILPYLKNKMKKISKYIVYAAVAAAILLLVYALFQSTRETFASANPIPSEAELTALEATFSKAQTDANKNNIKYPQMATNVLQGAPQSVKAVNKFLKANVIPLLPYRMAKQAQTPDGDMTDFYIILFMTHLNKSLIAPLAYAVRQQSSAPTIPAFVDMAIKTLKDNGAPPPPADWPMGDPQMKAFVDQMKKGETTVQTPEGETFPNPAYWGHKYIYGDAKMPAKSGPASASSAGGGISGSASAGKCTPSVTQVPGGVSEIRCFNM
jgi:hypothetical protein